MKWNEMKKKLVSWTLNGLEMAQECVICRKQTYFEWDTPLTWLYCDNKLFTFFYSPTHIPIPNIYIIFTIICFIFLFF